MSSDVEVHHEPVVARGRRREFLRTQLPVLAVIAVGGGLGAEARFGIAQMLPAVPGHFPWATFVTNVLGCLGIGVLMVLISERWSVHRLLRPFLGVGVLGGFTTFSTYAVEVRDLLRPGSAAIAFGYLMGTVVCALPMVIVGMALTRWVTGVARRARRRA